MKLTILERFLVQQLLPKKNSVIMLKEARKLREDLSISAEENKTVDFRVCSDWKNNGCPRCGHKDFTIEEDGPVKTTRRTCKQCDFRGAQGANGTGVWVEPSEPKDYEISEAMMKEIAVELKSLDKNKKIKEEHLQLYEKFVG